MNTMKQAFANIFMDTNVIKSKVVAKKGINDFVRGLNLYRKLTNAKIYTSSVCESEIFAQEYKKISDSLVIFESLKKKYAHKYSFPEISIDELMKEYASEFRKIGLFSNVLRDNGRFMDECIRRASYKIAPCTEKKEEFRDTVIRLSYLDVLKKGERCIFMTYDNHFNGCLDDHECVEVLKPEDFIKKINKELLHIDINDSKFLSVFSIEEAKSFIKYNEADDELFIDCSGTDFSYEKTNELDFISLEMTCIDFQDNKQIFSFSMNFLGGFRVFSDSGDDVSGRFLPEYLNGVNGICESLIGKFTYINGEISIDYDSFESSIEKVDIGEIITDMMADYYYDIYCGK